MKNFQLIIQSQLSRYPISQIEDLYKLTHQAALGSEHAVKDVASAYGWLLSELEEMVNIPSDPLFEEISPDGQIIRVHLKPFIDNGGEPEILLQAFVNTANEYQGSIAIFKQYWMSIEQLAEYGGLNFQPDELQEFNLKLGSLGYPAVHHSMQYKKAYHPHYRVIASEYLPQIIHNASSHF